MAILPDCENIPEGTGFTGLDMENVKPEIEYPEPLKPQASQPETTPDTVYVETESPQKTWNTQPAKPETTAQSESPQKTGNGGPGSLVCRPIGVFGRIEGMEDWCTNNCGDGQASCPDKICSCEPDFQMEPISVCKSAGAWEGRVEIDNWCNDNCNHKPRFCPPSHCKCEVIYF